MSKRDTDFGLARARFIKQVAYTEDIKLIFEKFIKPVLSRVDLEENESNFRGAIEAFFQVQTRDVFFARAKLNFKLPGFLVSELDRKDKLIPGAGRRSVKRGNILLVRTDKHMPDRIDIEFDDQNFQLNSPEYSVIKDHLKEVL